MCALVGIMMIAPTGSIFAPTGSAEGAPLETTLRIGLLGNISTLNPLKAFTENELFFASLIYDCLTGVDEDLNSTPNLAKSWYAVPITDPELVLSGEPYGAVWQYNLTNQSQWHDGEPFTAEDVNYTLNILGQNWIQIWAYQPYTAFIHHANATGEYTVRVHFWNPETGLPLPIVFGGTLPITILPKHLIQTMTVSQLGFSWNGTPVVGTGPFMARPSTYYEFVEGRNITLVRNPLYHWTADYGKQVHFDNLDLSFYSSEVLLRTALTTGQIDVARLNYSNYAQLEAGINDGSYRHLAAMKGLRADGYFTALSISPKSFYAGNLAKLDPIVRMALATATNRTGIIDGAYLGNAVNDSTLVSPLYPYWQYLIEPELFPYDPTTAAVLLNLFGYEDLDLDGWLEVGPTSLTALQGWELEGRELSFDLLVRSDIPEDMEIARMIQESYASIGIATVLRAKDLRNFTNALYSYGYDIAIDHVTQDTDPHRILFVESGLAVSGWSDNAYSSEEYDQNFSGSDSAFDAHTRQGFVQNCQIHNAVDLAYYVIGYPNNTYVVRTDTFTGWGNWSVHPGRSLDARWGANPLFFDLMPLPPNTAPTASFSVTPTTGDTLTVFEFNASGSTDAEDPADLLEIRWDWNGDGTWDTNWTATKTAQETFAAPGNYTVYLIVRDTSGLTNTTKANVTVSAAIPEFGAVITPVVVLALMAMVLLRTRRRQA